MGRPKKIIEQSILKDKKVKLLRDQDGKEHVVVIEEKTTYSFKNLRPGKLFFKRSNGSEDFFDGFEVREDIDEKERKMLLNTKSAADGSLVEESEDIPEYANAYNDISIKKLIKDNKSDLKKLQNIVERMDSDFAVRRIKDAFMSEDLPNSIIMFCDVKLQQLEEEEIERNKAPIDRES